MAYHIVKEFEEAVARYAGAPYAVAVESESAALLLCCMYRRVGTVTIPCRTYPSVPCSILLAGGTVEFVDEPWSGIYELRPYGIWDGALRFRRGMYAGGLHCVSFHMKKHLPIGRGGMVLTDDAKAARWLRLARFDGREEVGLGEQRVFDVIGINAYMTPEQAVRGLQLLAVHRDSGDMDAAEQGYPDLSLSPVYRHPVFVGQPCV